MTGKGVGVAEGEGEGGLYGELGEIPAASAGMTELGGRAVGGSGGEGLGREWWDVSAP